MLKYDNYLTKKLRNVFIYFSRSSYIGIYLFSMTFEKKMNLILINIFNSFCKKRTTVNFIDSILLIIIFCVYRGCTVHIYKFEYPYIRIYVSVSS